MALANKKAAGAKLGRPSGSCNKNKSVLYDHKQTIEDLLAKEVSLASIRKIINSMLNKPLSYNTYKNFKNKALSNGYEYNRQLF
jgi:DNA invertase Pin-like site-specific DNA recombinase